MKNFSPCATRALLLSLSLCGSAALAQEIPTAPVAPQSARIANPAQTAALQKAIKEGQIDAAKAAIAAGADVNASDKGGVSVLMRASAARQTELVELLLESGAVANALDKKGCNALFYALPDDPKPKKKKFGLGKVLKVAGGGLGMMMGGGMLGGFGSLLGGGGLESLMGGNLTSLLGGGPFNLSGKSGWSAIAGAALQGDAGGKLGIGQILSGSATNLSAGDWTHLLSSVESSNPKILEAMSQLGAQDGASSALWSQFLNAASTGDQAEVEQLMADPKLAPLLQQATAGLSAAKSELPGNASRIIIQMLIARGASASTANRDGETVAQVAQKRGLTDIAALFGGQ